MKTKLVKQLESPVVQDNRRVGARELVYVDGELAQVLAWNNIPTFYVKLLKEDSPKEVEPWRIKKIEKVTDNGR